MAVVRAPRWIALALVAVLVAVITVVVWRPSSGQADGPSGVVAMAPDGDGYVLVSGDGVVSAGETATAAQSIADIDLRHRVVGVALDRSGRGYWLATRDGGVFAFGGAEFHGSMGGAHLNSPVVGISSTPTGQGYWLVAADGGVFTFGDAEFHGSMGGHGIRRPVVGIAATATGEGYWLAAADGGVFSFGDAEYLGSPSDRSLSEPIVSIAATRSGDGYWLAASDDGVFAYGDAPFLGAHRHDDVRAIIPAPGGGYRTVDGDAGVVTYEPGAEPVANPDVEPPSDPEPDTPSTEAPAEPDETTTTTTRRPVTTTTRPATTTTTAAPAPTPTTAAPTPTTAAPTTTTAAPPPPPTPAPDGGTVVSTSADLARAAGTPGTSVLVAPGTYEVHGLVVASGVHLRAADPGNWPVLDCRDQQGGSVVQVDGSDATIERVVVRCSGTNRNQPASVDDSSWRPAGINITGDRVTVRHVRIEGTGNGMGAWSGVDDLLAEDIVAADIGWYHQRGGEWQGTGYALYAQGTGRKVFRDWTITGGTSYAVHIYGSDRVGLANMTFERFTVRQDGGMLLGGGNATMTGLVFRGLDVETDGTALQIGYGDIGSAGTVIEGSRLVSRGEAALGVGPSFEGGRVTGVTFAAAGGPFVLRGESLSADTWDGNSYVGAGTFVVRDAAGAWAYGDFGAWRDQTGFDGSSSFG
jgi:hypothetical protein